MSEADDIRDAEANGHSVFGASGAHRFLACPGSVRLSMNLPDTAGFEAAEGTTAHAVAEEWLRSGEKPTHLIDTTRTVVAGGNPYEILIDRAMLAYVGQYVEWMQDVPGDLYVEQRVDYSRLTPIPNQGGTADSLVLRRHAATLGDLKYGVGDKIEAANNPQLMLYALGALYRRGDEYDIDRVTLRIAQPRLGHFDEWHTTVGELHDFAEWAKGRMAQAWAPNPPFVPGPKQCRWCRAILVCEAARRKAAQIADLTFEDETAAGLPLGATLSADPVPLDTPTLARLVSWRKWLERLMQAAFDELDRRIKAGETADGWTLGRGRATRRFRDRAEAAAFLRFIGLTDDDIEKRTMKSPAEVEKTLTALTGASAKTAKAWIASLVETRPGGLVLVESNKEDRAENYEDVFGDET